MPKFCPNGQFRLLTFDKDKNIRHIVYLFMYQNGIFWLEWNESQNINDKCKTNRWKKKVLKKKKSFDKCELIEWT